MNESPDPNAMPGSSPTPAGPPPGPMGYQAPPPPPGPMSYTPPGVPLKRSNRGSLIIIGVLALVVVVVVAYVALTRDSSPGAVNALQVGDCFDEPGASDDIEDVQHVPCTLPHDGEVVAALTHPAPAGEAYPVVSGFDDYISTNCVPLWEAYTGRTWDTETELGLFYFHPTLSTWADGGRSITCYAEHNDALKLTASVKNIGAAPLPVATP